ncbi:MAG: hypothetical protein ACOYVD_08620 [Bacillota bacterium]
MQGSNKEHQRLREKMSTIGLGREENEASEALVTDLKKLNKNKFFFNLEGEKKGGSQD